MGPWAADHSNAGCCVFENQGAGATLCGNSLLTKFKKPREKYYSNCSLYNVDSLNDTFNLRWTFQISNDETITDMALNETHAFLKTYSQAQKCHKLLLLSTKTGCTIKVLDPPDYLNSDFKIFITRFMILIYDSSWLYIQNIHSSKSLKKIKLPYVGTPVRIDVSDNDSLIIIAPCCQKGEIMVVDILNSETKTIVLTDGFAEGSHWRGGGLAGRGSSFGVWMIFSDRFIDKSGRYKSTRRLHVTWKGLGAGVNSLS